MKNINIAIAGNQWITKFLIDKLIESGYKPSLIINISQDKSSDISGFYDLTECALENSIEIYYPNSYTLKNDLDIHALTSKKIDILLVFGWQRLIPEWLINITSFGVYGVHGGPEKPPRCRGRAVFNWALLLGYDRFYMYMFNITPGVDEGNILDIIEFDINTFDDVLTLYHKNCIVSSKMIIDQLPLIISKKNKLIQQKEEGATYLPKRVPENGGIFWDWEAKRILNLIRAVAAPYPGAFTRINGFEMKIENAHIFDSKIKFKNHNPGEIIEVFPNGDLIVMCSDEAIYIRKYSIDKSAILHPKHKFELRSGAHPEDPIL